jgi:hypothetical protein
LVEALLAIVRAQQDWIRHREETLKRLRDEIAILKGQKPRPQIAPSRLEQPAPRAPLAEGQKRPGSQKRPKNAQLTITQEISIPFPDRPAGSVSKGYEAYVVQELLIRAETTRYLRERIVTTDVLPGTSERAAQFTGHILQAEYKANNARDWHFP